MKSRNSVLAIAIGTMLFAAGSPLRPRPKRTIQRWPSRKSRKTELKREIESRRIRARSKPAPKPKTKGRAKCPSWC